MEYISIKNWCINDRPREKMEKHGAETLSESELIAILINTGKKGRSAVEVARDLLRQAGNLDFLAQYSIINLSTVAGIGKAKAARIMAALELCKRLKLGKKDEKEIVNTPEKAFGLASYYLAGKQQENLLAIFLNNQNKLLHTSIISVGGMDETIVDPRMIYKLALDYSATRIIIAHNHPAGDPSPSKADLEITSVLKKNGELMRIELVDHIIIAGDKYYSFAEKDLTVFTRR